MVEDKDLLLLGSIPLETVEDVFRMFGGTLGPYLPCIPDGEVGDRSYWITCLAYRSFHGHPQIETVRRPAPVDGVEEWRPRNTDDSWDFRVKKGVKAVKFGDPGWRLGYAKEAINSYFVFRTLRKEGILPKDLRFQVSLPMTNSAIEGTFHDPEDYDLIKPGCFERASGGTLFLDEIGEISPAFQAKLLRVLEDGEVLRVGSERPRKVDVRVVTATNRSLRQEVAAGRFREDL